MELSNQDIKEIISTSLSRSGIKSPIDNVVRQIIFSEANGIDWQKSLEQYCFRTDARI